MEDILISLEGFTNIFPLHHTERETCKRLWVLESIEKRDLEYLKILVPFLNDDPGLKVECIKVITREGWVSALSLLFRILTEPSPGVALVELTTGTRRLNMESLKFLTPYLDMLFEHPWGNYRSFLMGKILDERNEEAFKHFWEHLPPRPDRSCNLGMVCDIIHTYKALPEEERFLKMLDRLKGFACSPYDETPNRRFQHNFYGPLRWWWLRRFSKVKNDEKNELMMGKIKKLQLSILLVIQRVPVYVGKIILQQCGCFVLFMKTT